MHPLPVITPVRVARASLAALVIAGVASSGLAFAAGWTGPSSPAPFNNTPELIWNAQETGFAPQDASFNITGSGVLGQIAAGGFALDSGGIAITAPSIWAGEFGAGEAIVFGNLTINEGTGSLTLGGVPRTTWPADAGGDITGIAAGSNLVGGGDTGEISLDLAPSISVTDVQASNQVYAPTYRGQQVLLGEGDISLIPGTPNTLTVTNGRVRAREYCIGTSCITEWPAAGGGGGLDQPTADSRYVNITGDEMTGSLAISGIFDGSALTVNNGTTGAAFGTTVAAGVFERGSISTQIASGAYAGNFIGNVRVEGNVNVTNDVSPARLCLSGVCNASWPAAGGGAGTVTSVGSGAGLTGGPITGSGTLGLDTGYTDPLYVNASGGDSLSGVYNFRAPDLSNTRIGATVGGTTYGLWSERPVNAIQVIADSMVVDSQIRVTGGNITMEGASTITTPQLCLGSDCRVSWPAGGGGTVTSITQGTGITATPNPITGAGTIAFDQPWGDNRYVKNIGPETMTGEYTVNATSALQSLSVTNAGTGYALSASATGGGAAGHFGNSGDNYVNLAYGTYALFGRGTIYTSTDIGAAGTVTASAFSLGGVSKSAWPVSSKVSGTLTTTQWTTIACPAGSKVTGIACWQNDPANGYPGCASRSLGDTSVEIYRYNTNVVYTVYCLSGV